ncbi:Pentatricopeptide repeat-containing protein At1g50270 [Linum perenne]
MPPFCSNQIAAFLRSSCSIPQFELIQSFFVATFRSQRKDSSSLFLRRRRLHFSVHPSATKLWNVAIRDVSESSGPLAALLQYSKMRRDCVHPDEHTFPLLLKLISKLKDQDPLVLYPEILKHGLDLDGFVRNSLISALANYGNLRFARQVFDESPQRDVVAWTAMIDGYVRNGSPEEGFRCFVMMRLMDVKVDEFSVVSALAAAGTMGDVWIGKWIHGFFVESGRLGALDQGKWVHGYINRNSVELNSIVGTALIDMYMKCGCVNEACFVFNKLLRKGLYTWTAMINGLAMNGNALGSLRLFSQMMSSGIQPNKVTFLSVLGACSHGGLVNEGRRLFKVMKDECNLDPDVDHYGCMVDLLGRAGYLDEAMELIEEMPMEPTFGVWGALLNACVIHKNFELGEYIGKHLVKLQPDHCGGYSLLANMFSAQQMWEDAARVRKAMKGKRIDKSPGLSWIEVNGSINEFVASDTSHPDLEELYRMLGTFSQPVVPSRDVTDWENQVSNDIGIDILP